MLRATQPCRLSAGTRISAVLHAFTYALEQPGSFKNSRFDWCHKAQLDRYSSAPLLERVRLESLFGPIGWKQCLEPLDHRDPLDPQPSGPPVHAVKNVSLQIRKGETLALIGESGSGKEILEPASANFLFSSRACLPRRLMKASVLPSLQLKNMKVNESYSCRRSLVL